MTEEEFYKRVIFFEESITVLRQQYPALNAHFTQWESSAAYKAISKKKTKFRNKLLKFATTEADAVNISPELLYEMYLWWEKQPKVCAYCGLTEADMQLLHNQPTFVNKRRETRGFTLEIDRKQSHLHYKNLDNLTLACYWCNNAKTDTFTHEEFLQIGAVIGKIWKERLHK